MCGRARAIEGAVILLKGAMRCLECAMGVVVDEVVIAFIAPKSPNDTEVGELCQDAKPYLGAGPFIHYQFHLEPLHYQGTVWTAGQKLHIVLGSILMVTSHGWELPPTLNMARLLLFTDVVHLEWLQPCGIAHCKERNVKLIAPLTESDKSIR